MQNDQLQSSLYQRAALPAGPASITSDDKGTNVFRVYCPNPKCRCLLLRENLGTVVKRTPKYALPRLVASEASDEDNDGEVETEYFEVRDMMQFENIGFTKTLNGAVKFLTCADCDLGPLGFQEVGANAYTGCFLHASRVRYLVPAPATATTAETPAAAAQE
ncbi:hypothetical protein H9P43_004214 [Blastocladiella emersonii ATCC 22665]|nr:hypothetical protein H9P43_004214 [Blastocladiella emersonii ATCC 22665]